MPIKIKLVGIYQKLLFIAYKRRKKPDISQMVSS